MSTTIIFGLWFVILISGGLVLLRILHGRWPGFSFHAALGLLAWGFSLIAADAWRLGEGIEQQIRFYQFGMVAIALAYLALAALIRGDHGRIYLYGVVAGVGLAVMAIPGEWVVIQKSGELLLWVVIVACAALCWRRIDRRDFLAQLVWLIVVFFEGTGFLFHLDCQLLHGATMPRAEGSACDQIYSSPVSIISPVVTAIALGYTVIRYWISESRT